jgi:hypothetical protein
MLTNLTLSQSIEAHTKELCDEEDESPWNVRKGIANTEEFKHLVWVYMIAH